MHGCNQEKTLVLLGFSRSTAYFSPEVCDVLAFAAALLDAALALRKVVRSTGQM
jgi:hypothetical protein